MFRGTHHSCVFLILFSLGAMVSLVILNAGSYSCISVKSTAHTSLHSEMALEKKIAVVVPFIPAQTYMLKANCQLAASDEFRACKLDDKSRLPIDLVYYVSTTWNAVEPGTSEPVRDAIEGMLREHPQWSGCFADVTYMFANLTADQDAHQGLAISSAFDFSGPNLQLRELMESNALRLKYSHVLVLEPDTTPVRQDWLPRLWELTQDKERFWIKGSAFFGDQGPNLANEVNFGSRLTSTWTAMNGNAIYNIDDPAFSEFLRSVWNATDPKVPYDVAIHDYLMNSTNYKHTKAALTKIRFTSFIQNRGYTQYYSSKIRREYPETYLVHSKKRDGQNLRDFV